VGVKLGLSLSLREQHKLRVFEIRVLRRLFGLFGCKRKEVNKGCKI
jgi:hypothetical protein